MDLNADVGEGFGRWSAGDDAALLRVVTSVNVACGFHAGDPAILRRTCAAAVALGVRVGAHPGYRDLAGFGRRALAVPADVLGDEIAYQLGALAACARLAGTTVGHVKPHGALYHRCAADEAAAAALVDAVVRTGIGTAVVGPPGSALLAAAASAGLDAIPEAFADRAYRADGGLVDRALDGAVLDAAAAAEQAVRIATGRPVRADGGTDLEVRARTLCVHGDTPGAVAVATAVRAALDAAGVTVAPFA